MSRFRKIKNYFLAFSIPFVLCFIVFYFKGNLQNVENFFVTDLRIQHLSFFNYMKNVMLGKTSIFYSYYAGMGSPVLSTMIFYVISPINLLLLLIKDIQYSILFIYVIKISLAGLTMFIFLNNKEKNNSFVTILFSTCYALGAFSINYYFCVFWFDALYLAPLVMLGIDKIFLTEKINLLYIFSLALSIICNIQMGFGLCVFSVVYYIYSYNIRYDIKKDMKKFKQLSFIFLISSLCAGAISSGILLGFMTDYKNISAARDIEVLEESATTNIGYFLKNIFTVGNLKTDYFNNYEPYVYCGLIVSFYSILYFFSDEVDKKKRVHALGVVFFFIVSFSIKFLNLFWHLSTPVLLNYRYSIYLAMFLTMIAYECYYLKTKLVKKDIVVLSISLFIGLFMIIAFPNEIYIAYTFLFLVLVYVLIILSKKKYAKLSILLVILSFIEIGVNGYLSFYTSEDLPFDRTTSYRNLQKLGSKNHFNNNNRVLYNYDYLEYNNENFLLNNNSSLRYFSSVINGNLLNFFDRNCSMVGNNNYRVSAYDSPLLLSLLGVKNIYFTDEFNSSIYEKKENYQFRDYDYGKKSYRTKNVYLYENPFALSVGYVIDSDVKYKKSDRPFEYQNQIIKSFTGRNQDVIIELDYTDNEDYEICNESVDEFCKTFQVQNDTNNTLVYVYGLWDRYYLDDNIKSYNDTNKPLVLSTLNKSVRFALSYPNIMNEKYYFVTYDKNSLVDSLTQLQENMLESVKIDKNVMTAKLHSSKSGILFLSIPYDKHFQIYVDGKKVKYYSLLDNTFMGLDINEGEHDIKLEYVNSSYVWYIIFSGISVIVTFVLYYFINKYITIRKNEEEKIRLEMLRQKELRQAKMEKKSKKSSSRKNNKRK